jgi:hypothetical protein
VGPFDSTMQVIAQVMRDGVATHPDNEWVRRSPDYHGQRAVEHLKALRDGDQRQDHVALVYRSPTPSTETG